jgi:hypothetical protein
MAEHARPALQPDGSVGFEEPTAFLRFKSGTLQQRWTIGIWVSESEEYVGKRECPLGYAPGSEFRPYRLLSEWRDVPNVPIESDEASNG